MHPKRWLSLVLLIALVMTGIALTTDSAQARRAGPPLVFWKDGDLWTWQPGSSQPVQLTTWGYNERPVLSPQGNRVAYTSWAQITVQAVTQGYPVLGFTPSNIWVIDPISTDAVRVADQPANAVFGVETLDDSGIMRGTPSWSPDGTRLAWAEFVVPDYAYRLVVYDFASMTSQVIVPNLPFPYADGGFIPVHKVNWGSAGIAVLNTAVNESSFDFEETLYVYSPAGALVSQTVVGSSATEWVFFGEWVSYQGKEYFGTVYPSGKRFLIDPLNGSQQDMPAMPEMYSLSAPAAASVLVAPSSGATQNLSAQWTAVYPDRQNSQILPTQGQSFNVTVSPDGQQIVYAGDAIYVWQNGSASAIANTAVSSIFDTGVVWGPTAWRVRTDWPTGNVPSPLCSPAPRLTINRSGQVTPGLPNAIRTQPRRGSGSQILGYIPGNGVFAVVAGPQCGPEGRYWWQVDYQGIVGWTPEGESGIYWLQPYDAVTQAPVSCTLPPRLSANSSAYVLPGLPNVIRSQPTKQSGSIVIGRIPGGAYFNVLGGPQCGPEGIYWWQVEYGGVVGWTGEGQNGTYWVAPFGCSNSPAPRLSPGIAARVTPGDPNTLRTGAGASNAALGQIPGGATFTVLSGPQCGPEGWTWWRVNYQGMIGWTAEGQGSTYWLEPYNVPPPAPTCSLAPRLTIGSLARVTPGDSNILRSAPGRGGNSVILGSIPGGATFTVLSGPQCDYEGMNWWQVNYQGAIGWTPEGQFGVYWLEPYSAPPPPPQSCTLAPRLQVGAAGFVVPGPSNLIRSNPGTGADSAVLGQIPGGAFFRVLNGAVCGNDGRYWWQIEYQGVTGWTAEGENGNYWVSPFVCYFSQPTRLVPGMAARVTPGDPNSIRTQPGGGVVIGQIPGGGAFYVLSGPQCGPEGRIWWQVQYGNLVGWTAEGEGNVYWLEP